jgi:hypothetical protein
MVASGLEKVEGVVEANGEELCLLAAFAKFIFFWCDFCSLKFSHRKKKYKLL